MRTEKVAEILTRALKRDTNATRRTGSDYAKAHGALVAEVMYALSVLRAK